jgi:hypothetical protein
MLGLPVLLARLVRILLLLLTRIAALAGIRLAALLTRLVRILLLLLARLVRIVLILVGIRHCRWLLGCATPVFNRQSHKTFRYAAGSMLVARIVASRNPGSHVALSRHGSEEQWEPTMGRYALLWLIGVPIPILLLIYLFGGLS